MIYKKLIALVALTATCLSTRIIEARNFQFGFGFDSCGGSSFQFGFGNPAPCPVPVVQPVYYAPAPVVHQQVYYAPAPVSYQPYRVTRTYTSGGYSTGARKRVYAHAGGQKQHKKQISKRPGQQAASKNKPALRNLNHACASVLPYTSWPSKANTRYVLLGQEAFGRDANTWDDFGGKRDPQENHPITTAAREFAEETEFLLMNTQQAKNWIDVDSGHTKAVIASRSNRNATYITRFNCQDLERFTKKFNAHKNRNSEKKALAWVKWENLEAAIVNAKRDQNGRLLPVKVWAQVINSNNQKQAKQITLRPFLVKKLRDYVTHKPYVTGKNFKIRFY